MELTPIYRIEYFYDAIVNGTTPPEPIHRVEYFLAKIAGADVTPPEPIYRVERFLDAIIKGTTPPEPVYRSEFWLAKKAGLDVETPEPVYRVEYWLEEWVGSTPSQTLTVTGVSPLTLANAIAHSILSLTQTGKCEQASTPTPSAPVDIMCNNGALRMVDDELPSGYKRLLGITFDGEVYYVTDYHMRSADTLRFSFKATETGRNVVGCYNGTDATDNLSFYFSAGSTGVYLRYNGGLYRPVAWTNTKYNCVISPTGVTGLSTDASWTEVAFTSAAALFIGWLDNATSPKFKGDMYGSIVVDGRANIIPVERQSDGAIGYWDGQAFLENQGTGTPVSLGYDGSHYVFQTVGTPEVITVCGKNLLNTANDTTGAYINQDGELVPGTAYRYSAIIPVSAGKYVVSGVCNPITGNSKRVHGYLNGVWQRQLNSAYVAKDAAFSIPVTVPSGVNGIRLSYYTGDVDAMIEEGETATEYEAYASHGTASAENLLSVPDTDYADTQEVIGGTVTRKVGVKVLTGDNTKDGTWGTSGGASNLYSLTIADSSTDNTFSPISTHFVGVLGSVGYAAIQDGQFKHGSNSNIYFFKDTSSEDVNAFKARLAAQYANGTPVIVVYPLATETTEQTTPHSLHTAQGTNTVSVTAEVSGISLTCEYKGAADETP